MTPAERVANIGVSGATRRRRNGYVWLVAAIVASVALIASNAERSWRVLLVIPFGLAAIGLLQAREKT